MTDFIEINLGCEVLDLQVSVVVTTKNEGKNISNCLQSVMRQSFPSDHVELIVVDNNSSDDTVSIAESFTSKVYTAGPERSVQRNLGVEKAIGEYILYLDADMVLSSNLIKDCVEMCENGGYIALYIPERIIGKGFWIKVRDFERSFYDGTCIDAVRFVRRDKFLEVRGFDTTLTGPEDWDFDRRIRVLGKVGVVNGPLFHNEGEFNLREYLAKKKYYLSSFDKYIMKWGKNDSIVRKQLGLWYRLFGIYVEDGKWKRLLRHPLLTLGMAYLRFRVGLIYLKSK